MRRALLSLPVAAIVLLLSSCGDPTVGTDPAGTAPPSATGTPVLPTSAPTSPPTAAPTADPTSSAPGGTATKTPAGREITVEGVVESGVEPGCKVLSTPAGQYQVLGDDVPLGVTVRITGRLIPGVSTTCQQGTPLRVVSVQRR